MPVSDISKPAPAGTLALACAIVAALTVMFGYSCSDDNPAAPDPAATPLRITDLRDTLLTGNSLELLWTAPGNDSTVIASYEVRYSVAPYDSTGLWWDSLATPLTLDRLLAKPGEAQRLWVEGLAKSTAYEFACRAVSVEDTKDEAQPVSNILRITTPADVAPNPIADLVHISWLGGRAVLTWSIPGDTDSHPVSNYDLRYTTSEDSLLALWDLVSNRIQTTHIGATGDTIGTRTDSLRDVVYFAGIRSAGADGMWSATSNIVALEPQSPDPDDSTHNIRDFRDTLVTGNSVVLHWTVPSLDSNQIERYEVRYMAAPYDTTPGWDSLATTETLVKLLGAPGTKQYVSIEGLDESTFYQFVCYGLDGSGLVVARSGLRRIATSDRVPPLPVDDLSAQPRVSDTPLMKWTVPSDPDGQPIIEFELRHSTSRDSLEYAWHHLTTRKSLSNFHGPGGNRDTAIGPLNPEQSYFVGIRATGPDLMWSGLSNIVFLDAQDHVPPATITDLSVRFNAADSSFTAFFTAAGDDSLSGFSTINTIRYLDRPPEEDENWGGAGFFQSEVERPGGERDSIRIPRTFRPGRTFYFVIQSRDDVGNWSQYSNVASGATQPLLHVTVPGDFDTIAEAVAATVKGDTIFAACGVHDVGSSLRIAGQVLLGAGRDCTTIRGDGSGPVLVIDDASVSGISITGGPPDSAAVEFRYDFSISVLQNCRVHDNPGLGVLNSHFARLVDCDIERNGGGGLLVKSGSVWRCRIRDNDGFGVYMDAFSTTGIDSCEVSSNSGVGVELVKGYVRNSHVFENVQGGIRMASENTTVFKAEVFRNGTCGIDMASGRVESCLVYENIGNGIRTRGPETKEIVHCKMYENQGHGAFCEGRADLSRIFSYRNEAGGIAMGDETSLRTSTVTGNAQHGISILSAPDVYFELDLNVVAFNAGNPIHNPSAHALPIRCCLLYEEDPRAADPVLEWLDVEPALENFAITWRDPLFCDSESDDFATPDHREWGGDRHGSCDGGFGPLGAEICRTREVNQIATRVPSERSLKDAVLLLAEGDTIEFDAGTHHYLDVRTPRSVVLRGASEDADDTVIDLQQAGRFLEIEGVPVLLENLTVRNGRIWQGPDSGGAVYVSEKGSLIARNCVFKDNRAYYRGGAIYAEEGHLSFDRCLFLRNRADLGGAIAIQDMGPDSDFLRPNLQVDDCLFAWNIANREGGAINDYSDNFLTTYRTSTFAYNTDQDGHHIDGGNAYNCIFAFGQRTGTDVPAPELGVYRRFICNDFFELPEGVEYVDTTGTSNFSLDPLFCDPENDNFTLYGHSPCVDRKGCGQVGAFGVGCELK